jgi:hypothetical protein
LRHKEKHVGHGEEESGHRQRDEQQSPAQVAQRHIGALEQPGEKYGDRDRNRSASAGEDERVENHPIGQRIRIRDEVIIEGKRSGRGRVTGAKAADHHLGQWN